MMSCKKEYSCEGCANKNQPPVAIAGSDEIVSLPTDSILLDGSRSNDADGKITEWLWAKISGPSSFKIISKASSKTFVKNLTPGVYLFELKVMDNGGLSAKDTIMITVDAMATVKHAPVANAGKDTTITLPANTLLLDGSNSVDPDNNISTYKWTRISGPSSCIISNADAVQTQVTALVQGVYLFELKVTDTDNLFSLDTVQVIMNPANSSPVNHAPVACAGKDQTILLPSNSVTLDGTCSTDADNDISSYIWAKISGPSSSNIATPTAAQTQVNDLASGIYLFELKVTDAAGLFSKDTVQVMVWSQPPPCTNCKIVFVSSRDGNPEIYSCNVDGSNIRRLTNDAGTDDQPAWSPDGTRIAFISDRSGNPELYVMNADGSNVVRKTFSGSYSQNPAWSPDGTRIAYSTESNYSANIWVVSAISGSPSLLFMSPGLEDHPAWSPDGKKIALSSDWNAYDLVYDIFTINADGTAFTCITDANIFDHFDYFYPGWSPNGTRLALLQASGINALSAQLGIVNSDGSEFKIIASSVAPLTKTSWSADGTKIAYTSLSGSRRDVSWISSDGSVSGVIVVDGWNADWQH